MLYFISRTEEACFGRETEERASELGGSIEVLERIQLIEEGGKTDSGRESRWERKKYIPHLSMAERMKKRV